MSSWLFTILLGTVLILLIIVNIFVFLSGPARKIEADDRELFRKVVESYALVDASFVNRHVHQRITFIAHLGLNKEKLIFFDEDGVVFLLIDTPIRPLALNEMIDSGLISEENVTYGYFEGPVFVIDDDRRLQYMNISGETVFFLRKGD
jgi:hypothetical protein